MRYLRLAPPPLCRTVILPCAFRPAFFFMWTTKDLSGLDLVISAKSEVVMCLREGVYGL